MGIRCQPAAASALVQAAVRFVWAHAISGPPMYTPIARNGEASQFVIAVVDGAEQASNPSPSEISPAGAGEGGTVVVGVVVVAASAWAPPRSSRASRPRFRARART